VAADAGDAAIAPPGRSCITTVGTRNSRIEPGSEPSGIVIATSFPDGESHVIARAAARKRDEIPEERCLGCEDACCSCLCWYCTSMQLMRHEGLTNVGGRYRLLSATGEAHV
jgi:hypothetical protein